MFKWHYGITVDSEKPTTGVFSNNSVEWLGDELMDAVNLTYEEHCLECNDPECGHEEFWENQGDTELIGFKEVNGEWEIDYDAEYSAITRECYTQVIHSQYVIRCALCSPCYPGQGDADTPGEFLAYSFPPDVLGETFDRIKDVKPIK